MEAEFSLIDVFSDRPFGGNQLAVFPRAEGHGKVTEVSVGGRATIIGHGIITIPGQEPAD